MNDIEKEQFRLNTAMDREVWNDQNKSEQIKIKSLIIPVVFLVVILFIAMISELTF